MQVVGDLINYQDSTNLIRNPRYEEGVREVM
jgi:hypothetical protein